MADLGVESAILSSSWAEDSHQNAERCPRRIGQAYVLSLGPRDEPTAVNAPAGPPRRTPPDAPERFARLRPLPDQELADAEYRCCALGLNALHGHETRGRAARRFEDPRYPPCRAFTASGSASLRWVGSAEPRAPASRSHGPRTEGPRSEMRARTRFHRDDTARLPAENSNTCPRRSTCRSHPVRPHSHRGSGSALRQIEPLHGHFAHRRLPSWIAVNPPWHNDAVGGRLQHHSSFGLANKMARGIWAVMARGEDDRGL